LEVIEIATANNKSILRIRVDRRLESVAEEEGFEPSVPVRVRRFSRPLP
jgi:hypothetical protein